MPSGAAASMSASSLTLQLEVLGRALLHEVARPARAVARSGSNAQPGAVGALGEPELGQRRPGGVDEVAQPLLGVGRRVPGDDVVAVGQEVRHPAAADHAGAGAAHGADVGRRRTGSGRLIRTSASGSASREPRRGWRRWRPSPR